jgi:riboflavin synthase
MAAKVDHAPDIVALIVSISAVADEAGDEQRQQGNEAGEAE